MICSLLDIFFENVDKIYFKFKLSDYSNAYAKNNNIILYYYSPHKCFKKNI